MIATPSMKISLVLLATMGVMSRITIVSIQGMVVGLSGIVFILFVRMIEIQGLFFVLSLISFSVACGITLKLVYNNKNSKKRNSEI